MTKNIIGYQGVEGAHSDMACRRAYPYAQTKPYSTFEDVFEAVSNGEIEIGIIPIENSYAGRVAEVHNILANTELHIIGEYFQKIEHHLLAVKGTKIGDIKDVVSHPQALMQCAKSIKELGLNKIEALNTAIAAKNIAESGDKTKAAIASELAAEIYNLDILQRNVQTAQDNQTIFIAVAKEPIDPEPADNIVTTLLFTIRNIPAALYKSLGGFATNNVNMLKLESYIPGGQSDMADFFISFQGHPKERRVQLAIEELGFFTRKVKLLGVYPGDSARFSNS
ncbi:MAG: prephenate dehydratase [Alphaproteobacteria bacterium CG11_big_fil_rev_8_21_14_0_20_44_7]|nr:MAG: prephenate dehydratase [Alphaproteobacteria bacterium CG11_big_fil_rev_8_21_14_0_20_44_7]